MKDKELVKEINGILDTTMIVKDYVSSPDAMAVVVVRVLLSALKQYQEEKMSKSFNKEVSLELDKLETLSEYFKKAGSPK